MSNGEVFEIEKGNCYDFPQVIHILKASLKAHHTVFGEVEHLPMWAVSTFHF